MDLGDSDDGDVEPGDGVVYVGGYLYAIGVECKYCDGDAVSICVIDEGMGMNHFPVCEGHEDTVEEQEEGADFYELDND
jgi:hypothetical protein